MDKSLICKIIVTTKAGGRKRGTGYAIARDRIITAAHVVEGAADQPHAIELYFGEQIERLVPKEAPTVCWSGTRQGGNGRSDVDVAIIRCELPEELRSHSVAFAEGTIAPTDFHGCGYSVAGKTEKENGQYDFSGSFPQVTGESHQASVDAVNGPRADHDDHAAQLWGGISGASLFQKAGQPLLLGVVTDYVRDHELPRLRVVPMPFLLRDEGFRDAIRYGESVDTDKRNDLAKEKLRVLAEKVLKSDATRKFILKCNELSEAMSASDLARKIFESLEPMSFLRRCVRQEEYKLEFADKKTELSVNICRLVELIAPVCFVEGDLAELERHLKQQAPHAEVETRDTIVARSRVAFIKRVSLHLEDGCDWPTVSVSILPVGREIVTSLPHPPELGIFADGGAGREDIVEMFQSALVKILTPDNQTLARVQAALKDLTDFEKVFFCVLFPTRLSDENLRRLNKAFPELVLLTARDVDDAPHQRVLDQIQRIREEFGPQPTRET